MLSIVKSEPVQPKYNLLCAITALGLAARIHGTDKAVMETAYRLLSQMAVEYQPIVLNIMNSKSPLIHINTFVANLPDRILNMRPTIQQKKPA